jgi:hypothetical protein
MHLDREDVLARDKVARGNVEWPAADRIGHGRRRHRGVTDRARRRVHAGDLHAVQIQHRAVIDEWAEAENPHRRVAGDLERPAEVIGVAPGGDGGVLRRRQGGLLDEEQPPSLRPRAVIVSRRAPRCPEVHARVVVFPGGGDRDEVGARPRQERGGEVCRPRGAADLCAHRPVLRWFAGRIRMFLGQ